MRPDARESQRERRQDRCCRSRPCPTSATSRASTAKIRISIAPSQNCGSERPTSAKAARLWSSDAARPQAGADAERHADERREHDRDRDEQRRVGQPVDDQVADGRVEPVGLAEIERGQVADVLPELDWDRAVEAEVALDCQVLLLGRVGRQQGPRRVGAQSRRHEHGQRDDRDHADSPRDPPGEVAREVALERVPNAARRRDDRARARRRGAHPLRPTAGRRSRATTSAACSVPVARSRCSHRRRRRSL